MTKVLLVEDDQEQSFLFQTVFNVSGLTAFAAANCKDALNIVNTEKPDIVLLDVMLNNENGLDVLEKIKTDEATKNILVFIFTNSNKQEFRDRAANLGASGFIIKSETTPQEMVERIKTFLKVN